MSNYPSKEQVQELMEYVGSNLHLPQLVQHFDKSNIYDTNEKLVGQWIDGKPLYQKVVNIVTPTSDSAWHDVATLDTECKIVMYKGFVDLVGTGAISEIGYDTRMVITCSKINAVQIKNTLSEWNSKQGYVIVQYTKTTDTALTYRFGTEADYSTSERLVGSWIDGSPIYQKTIMYTGNLTRNAWTYIDTGINDLGIPLYFEAGSSVGTMASVQLNKDTQSHGNSYIEVFNLRTQYDFAMTFFTLRYTKLTS